MMWITKSTLPILFFFELKRVCSDMNFHSVYVITRLSSSLAIGVSIGRSICSGVV